MQKIRLVTDSTIPFLTRNQFFSWFRANWEQGEHVSLVGMTGSGKTTVASKILGIRGYVVVLAVKLHDDTLKRFPKEGYKIIKKWPPPSYTMHKVVLWLKPENIAALDRQSIELQRVLNDVYISGGWCVDFDDAGYIAGHLGLGSELGVLLNQGRSSKISVVCCMTRPKSMVARVPSETLSQCRHLMLFKYTDEREIKSIAEISGINYREMSAMMDRLPKYHFIYVGKDQIFQVGD